MRAYNYNMKIITGTFALFYIMNQYYVIVVTY